MRAVLRCMPDPHPDELIYSVWARFSDHVGYPSATAVFQDLFGEQVISPIVDLPCYLQQFCSNLSSEVDLDADAIIDHHTLWPYYQPFISVERGSLLRQQMIAGTASAIYFRLGTLPSCIARQANLRYCPRCLETDKALFGESYWHRLHQAPGVEICLDHKVFLEDSIFSTQAHLSQRKFISAQCVTNSASPRDAHPSPFYGKLKAIAENVSYLLNHALPSADAHFIHEHYLSLLAKQHYLTPKGHTRVSQFISDFLNFYSSPLLDLLHFEFDRIPIYSLTNSWFMQVFKKKKTCHPLLHILTLLFLQSSLQQCLHAPLSNIPALLSQGPWPCLNPVCPLYKQLCIPSCQIRKISHLKEHRGTFTCTCGFTYSRKISQVTSYAIDQDYCMVAYGSLWERALRELWQNRQRTLVQIAQTLGVSDRTISRKVIELGLPHREDQPGRPKSKPPSEAEVASHREKWLKTIAAFPDRGRAEVSRKSEGAYAWLKVHDKTWLDANLPPCKAPPSITWPRSEKNSPPRKGHHMTQKEREERDRDLAERVKKRAQALINAPGPPQRVTLQKLREKILSFPTTVLRRRHCPLTDRALMDVIESTEHFASRRVYWLVQQCLAERKSLTRWELIQKAGVKRAQNKPLVQIAIQEAMRKLVSLE
jgi:hypothetical protein